MTKLVLGMLALACCAPISVQADDLFQKAHRQRLDALSAELARRTAEPPAKWQHDPEFRRIVKAYQDEIATYRAPPKTNDELHGLFNPRGLMQPMGDERPPQ